MSTLMAAKLRRMATVLLFMLLAPLCWADTAFISPADAFTQAQAGKLTIIDVRTREEWRQSGLPAGAIPISLQQPGGEAAFPQAVLAAVGGDRDRPIAVICRSGRRSHQAQQWLQQAGFTHVLDIRGGMAGAGDSPGWLGSGLPTAPCPDCN